MAIISHSGIGAELTRQAQELVHVGTWVVDFSTAEPADFTTGSARWSDEMFRLFGLEPQSIPIRYDTYMSFVEEGDRARLGAILGEAFGARHSFEFDARMVTKHLGVRTIHSRGSVITDTEGRVTRLLGTCVDVTERVQQEEALAASEGRFRSVFEQSGVGLAIVDAQHHLVRGNASFAKFLGYEASEMTGLHLAQITHPDDLAVSVDAGRRSVVGASQTYEKRYVRKDGTFVWGRATVTPLHDTAGLHTGWIGVVEDINTGREAGEALRRQTEILQGILDHLPVMVVRVGRACELLYSNSEAQRVFGWSTGGTRPSDIIAAAFPDDLERARVRAAIAAGGAKWLDFEPRSADGRAVPSSWASVTLSDGTALMIGQDLTERRQMQQRLSQAQKMEALGQLAGGIAHDFNNILTVMTACASFIQEAAATDDSVKDATEILTSCDRATALTGQLLAFSRRQMLQPEVINVNTAVSSLARTMHRLIGETINLEVDASAAKPNVEVDRYQLEQVILNLTVNARDAIRDEGTITLSTSNGTDPLGRDELILSVRDDGTGIDPALRQRIFEPFFTTKPMGKGTGLGLATVHGIVEQSGGRIELDSTPGEGTEFRIILPCVAACVFPSNAPRQLAVTGGTETILLVEDENGVRVIARRMLVSLGYTVLEARHGRDAIEIAASHAGAIDLLITDVVMPELGGRELATRLRARQAGLPVLYISGYTDDELLRKGILEPGFKLLRKPFGKDVLARAVRSLLDDREERGDSGMNPFTEPTTQERLAELVLR